MFTIRNLVEQYTNRKAEILNKSYKETINTTSLCIIFKTMNGTRIFLDMHPDSEYTKKEEQFKYQIPNKNNVFRKFDFEILSGDNIVLTKGINFKPWDLNEYLKYYVEPITEKKFNEFILDNGGIDTEELTENINNLWNLKGLKASS